MHQKSTILSTIKMNPYKQAVISLKCGVLTY